VSRLCVFLCWPSLLQPGVESVSYFEVGDCVACTAVSGGCEKIQRSAKCFVCALVCSVVILLGVLPCVPVYESALSQERLLRDSIEWIG
jgi:hypothetical protein